MNQTGLRRMPPDQLSGSGLTFGTPRHPGIKDPILSKRVCFYKSGDPQFSGLRMVINNRTFKTFDALLDSLSKKVPLPFGVRNITTPRGVHAIYSLDELEDGKSYICSDRRKVKPINLAQAEKKLAPWYHARPATARRRAKMQAKSFPGRNIPRQEQVVVRMPKKLLVFRNGDPTFKRKVVLHKRNTVNYESILGYISEMMQFSVVKLHTPDGRRVDGLPGLILCSGTVVAAGREPFKSANYNSQTSPASSQFSSKRKGRKRSKSSNRKKKTLSYQSSKSRNFSLSSERYIVDRIHNSMAGSSYDGPTNSVELESSRMLESVVETEGDTCLGDAAEGQSGLLPTEDDIEKSFRVNQDGSMTVEMKVRLTLKEEETIHWTTTLSRSTVVNDIDHSYLLEPMPDEEMCLPDPESLELQSPGSSTDSIYRDKSKDNNDEEPPTPSNGALSTGSKDEESNTVQTNMGSPTRMSMQDYNHINKKQASVESIKSLKAGFQEGMVGSYSYTEQTQNGAMTEQYCVVKQGTKRPVPKPRRLGSVDSSSISRNITSFKSSEVLQIESSGEEVTETVLHIYEQQTCQDNFLANICERESPLYRRPATSETGQYSNSEHRRPSTASESISIWRMESMSRTSDLTLSSLKTAATQTTSGQQQFMSIKGKVKSQQREVKKGKRKPKHTRRLKSPGKRDPETKTFSSAGYIKKIYGTKSKSPKSRKPQKRPKGTLDDTKHSFIHPKSASPPKENQNERVSVEAHKLDVASTETSRGALTRQTSMHQEKKRSGDVSESKMLRGSGTNYYVQHWLEKAQNSSTSHTGKENEKLQVEIRKQDAESGFNHNVTSEIEPSQILTSETSPERTSVKLRVKCIETKLSSPAVGRKPSQHHPSITSMENSTSMTQTEDVKPLLNGIGHEMNPNLIKISLQQPTSCNALSMEYMPPPPPPEELERLTNAECCMMDVSSVASSPLYRISSLSSHMSDNHPSSMSSISDKGASPTQHTMEVLVQDDGSSLQRAPSIKRAPLVSNQSLERKMSLRKASLTKYTLGREDSSDTLAPNSTNDASNMLPNSICTPRLLPIKTKTTNGSMGQKSIPSNYTSASPISVTSEARMSSDSISSTETPVPSDAKLTEAKPGHKEPTSPKQQQKKVKIMSSPSQNRKSQSKKLLSDLSNDSPQLSSRNGHHSDNAMSPSIAKREHSSEAPSPLTERRKMLSKAKLPKRQSPYSQSLDMMSPPFTNRSQKKKLSRNLSNEYALQGDVETSRKTSSRRKRKTSQSRASTAEREETPTHVENPKQKESEKQYKLLTMKVTNQPHIKPMPTGEKTLPASDSKTSASIKKSISDVTEEENANVDLRNRVNAFASQATESEMHCIPLKTVTLRQKLPTESKGPTHNTTSPKKDGREDLDSCKDEDLSHMEESIHDTELAVGEEGQRISGACKDQENCKEIIYSPNEGEEEEEEEAESLRRHEGSEEYVMLGVRNENIPGPDPPNQTFSEEEQVEESEIQRASTDGNAIYSDVEEPTYSEEEFEMNERRFRSVESSMPGTEEENEGSDEEDQPPVPAEAVVKCNKLKALIEEEEEAGSEDDGLKKGAGHLIQSANLVQSNSCCTDEDGSCEEQMEDATITLGQIRSSIEEELSFSTKESFSDKEEEGGETRATTAPEEMKSKSVAERVDRLEKQAADALKRKSAEETPALKRGLRKTVIPESDVEDALPETPSSQSALCPRSAAQSSLSFSYDSSGVITTEPEGNRVKSIREMFLAKGASDIQVGNKRQPSPNATGQRVDTSASGGYQSQTSPELSSGDDDSARKSITKGFVRRTIERLYGKKDPDELLSERPSSASKQKKKEHSGFFSPLHSARTKAMNELSYFNSTSALDTLTEATRCIAFNAQVGPGDAVSIDNGQWLVREDALIRKSVSDPVAINKTLANTPPSEKQHEDTEQNTPYSLFSSTPDPEEKTRALWRKCTYFSLPHASDSDACQDELSSSSKTILNGDTVAKDIKDSEDAKTRGERNGILPSASDFKIVDNKVHPADNEVVVRQPARGQGVMNRRLQDPDMLDLLYNFCGENCPIL